MKTIALSILIGLTALSSSALAGSKWKCIYTNADEFNMEAKETPFVGKSHSKKKAAYAARIKCKLGTKKLQKKYHNKMIKASMCEKDQCREVY
ncbi:MAG: hypothetical protein CMP10_08110 [Zetaproteobacteria bacterium]|nr:hypothetical protein [Pseudobdellovibrionaceae bacterium]